MLDDNEHPVYDNRSTFDAKEVVTTAFEVSQKVIKARRLISRTAMLVLGGPIVGFAVIPFIMSIFKITYLEGVPALLLLLAGVLIMLGMWAVAVILLIRDLRRK